MFRSLKPINNVFTMILQQICLAPHAMNISPDLTAKMDMKTMELGTVNGDGLRTVGIVVKKVLDNPQ